MTLQARKILLPSFTLTEVCNSDYAGAAVQLSLKDEPLGYSTRPVNRGSQHNEAELFSYNLMPVVVDQNSVPWGEANIYLLSRLTDSIAPSMSTYAGIADDLSAYRRFLDETAIDWLAFPSQKLSRPTYKYNARLRHAVAAGEIAAATARRRMGAVISFYRWLKADGVLPTENALWKESDRYIELKDAHGFKFTKKVITTDVSIRVAKQEDPYDGKINDGGKLRPLAQEEQEWLLDALASIGNTEMTLIHLMGMLTGARIQTILTFRVRHALLELDDIHGGELRFPIGPGTGIDTKNDKQMVLHIPIWFYKMLRTYVHSDRAKKRRERATGGDNENQYLFLSVRGVPFYRCKEESRAYDATNTLRHNKVGQAVRQFITEQVIPFVRTKYGARNFHYQFHDTRATFGMNMTDHQLKLVEQGKTTLKEVREFVKTRMGHESAATTDLYLQYRSNLKLVRWVGVEYESHLKKLSERAMKGLL